MEEFLKLFSVRDILLHMLNTAILFIAIRLLVYKPVRKFLDARTARVTDALAEATATRGEADRLLAEAQDARRTAEADAAKLQADGALSAQQAGDALIGEARRQADEMLRSAEAEAEAMHAAAQEEIQAQALAMAVEISEKMIGRELAEKDNEVLAREFLTKVG